MVVIGSVSLIILHLLKIHLYFKTLRLICIIFKEINFALKFAKIYSLRYNHRLKEKNSKDVLEFYGKISIFSVHDCSIYGVKKTNLWMVFYLLSYIKSISISYINLYLLKRREEAFEMRFLIGIKTIFSKNNFQF